MTVDNSELWKAIDAITAKIPDEVWQKLRDDHKDPQSAHSDAVHMIAKLWKKAEDAGLDVADEATKAISATCRLLDVAKRQKPGGLHVTCDDCGELLTEPGALRLHIGIPDADGKFEGQKQHVCERCENFP